MERSWSWVLRYGIGMFMAVLLGLILSRLPLFQATTFPIGHIPLFKKPPFADFIFRDTALRASYVVQYIGYGSALLLFLWGGHRAARQIRSGGKGRALLRRLITPVTMLIVLSAGYHVFLLPGEELHLSKARMELYNEVFVVGILLTAVWLTVRCLRPLTPLSWSSTGAAPHGVSTLQLHVAGAEGTTPVGTNLPGTQGADRTTLLTSDGNQSKLGRYDILEELGRGAMGVVYLGKDPVIQRTVAVKTIQLNEADPDHVAEAKERFFREAESAGRLSHPNIVTIFDAGEERELAFIAMENLDGTNLREWCGKDNLLPVKRVLEIGVMVAEALDYAHNQGVVHRDIKPANIMVLKDGTVKVTDFGIARMTSSSQTQTGVLVGTPSYMSPEQLAGSAVDGRSDLFSLGVVLFELLTGEKPFEGDNMATLLYQIANQPHPSLRKIRPDLPRCCKKIVDRAMEKKVEERYQRGSEMAKDLAACR